MPQLQLSFTDQQIVDMKIFLDNKDFQGAYRYINDIIHTPSFVDPETGGMDYAIDSKTRFWFENAAHVNANDSNAASAYIRDVTRSGFWYGQVFGYGPVDENGQPRVIDQTFLQKISDSIITRVINQIVEKGGIVDFESILQNDIKTALIDAKQTLGGWGGSFYYWNVRLDTGLTIGETIRADPADYEKFITINAIALQAQANNRDFNDPAGVWGVLFEGAANAPTAAFAQAPLSVKYEIFERASSGLVGNPNYIGGFEFNGTDWGKYQPGAFPLSSNFIKASPEIANDLNLRRAIIQERKARLGYIVTGTETAPGVVFDLNSSIRIVLEATFNGTPFLAWVSNESFGKKLNFAEIGTDGRLDVGLGGIGSLILPIDFSGLRYYNNFTFDTNTGQYVISGTNDFGQSSISTFTNLPANLQDATWDNVGWNDVTLAGDASIITTSHTLAADGTIEGSTTTRSLMIPDSATGEDVVETFGISDKHGNFTGTTQVRVRLSPEKQAALQAAQYAALRNTDGAIIGNQIGQLFGSSIGQLIGGDNTFARIGAGTVLGTVLGNLGQAAGIALGRGLDLDTAIAAAFDDFGVELGGSLRSSATGAVSAFLTAELTAALGLDGPGLDDRLFSEIAGTVVSTGLDNAVSLATALNSAETTATLAANAAAAGQPLTTLNASALFQGLDSALSIGIAGFVGTTLAHEIVAPQTTAGSIGGSIGGTLGGAVGLALTGTTTGLGAVGGAILKPAHRTQFRPRGTQGPRG